MKTEIWLGKIVQPHEFTDDKSCKNCIFHNITCGDVDCIGSRRDDGKDVYYTDVVEPTPCCQEYDTCSTQTCIHNNNSIANDDDFVEVGEDESHLYNETTARQWEAFAVEQQKSINYYRDLLDEIGEMLGIDAYTSDDGSIQDSVVRANLPLLVAKKVYENVIYKNKSAV